MLYVGQSDITYKEFRGNFFINNYAVERLALAQFKGIEKTDISNTVQFSIGDVAAVSEIL